MEIYFDKSFYKSLNKINDRGTKAKVFNFIETVKSSNKLSSIPNVKKLRGFKDFYRYKMTPYRIGFQVENNKIILITIKHRKEIYRKFP
jgi:mRNA interferase RelE/StbE